MSTCAATSSRVAVLAGVLLLGGCALIMEGTSQKVSFDSDPAGASFSVGGRTAVTPGTLVIAKEDYRVVFTKPGYHPQEFQLKRQVTGWFYGSVVMGVISASIDVLTGAWQEFQTDKVRVVLEPLPGTTIEERSVRISSSPPGAEVLIAGVVQGRTPLDLKLGWRVLEEEKEVTLQLAAYHPKKVPLKRGDAQLPVALDPEPVLVKVHVVSSPSGADARLDGRAVGRTPLYTDVTWLPGQPPKVVEISKPGYRTEKKTLTGVKDAKVEAELAEVFEEVPLGLQVFPAGAQVEVDGVPAAVSDSAIRLRWSVSLQRHTLRVSHPGYRSQAKEVTVQERGGPVEFRLQPALPKSP